MTGSNRRHSRCKRDALPTELIAPSRETHAIASFLVSASDRFADLSGTEGTQWKGNAAGVRLVADVSPAAVPTAAIASRTTSTASRTSIRSQPSRVVRYSKTQDSGRRNAGPPFAMCSYGAPFAMGSYGARCNADPITQIEGLEP